MLSVLWLFILVDITGLPILVMSLRSALRLVERYGVIYRHRFEVF